MTDGENPPPIKIKNHLNKWWCKLSSKMTDGESPPPIKVKNYLNKWWW